MVTFYPTQTAARAEAAAHALRETVPGFVVRGESLLVLGHADVPDAGVQVPAGGVEFCESPAQAGVRELSEESGLVLTAPRFPVSYRREAPLPERFTRQVCHASASAAPASTPDIWTRHADGHYFAFRWAPFFAPRLDWEIDAALPWLTFTRGPLPASGPVAAQETTA